MSRHSRSADHIPAFRDGATSTSCAVNWVRLSTLSLIQTGLLLALVLTLVVWAVGPAATNGESPAWSIATGNAHGVGAAAFSAGGRRLAAGGHDGCMVLWEVGTGCEKELSHHPRGSIIDVKFSRDGTTLASVHANGANSEIVLWDATTGQERGNLTGYMNAIRGVDFAPDGATIAAGCDDRSIRLWDLASGTVKATLRGHSSAVRSVRFSPDGRTLASGSNDGTLKLWDVSSGKCRQSFGTSAHYAVASLAFSPGGSTLASGSVGDGIRLWDAATGLALAASSPEGPGVREVAFSADGQRLLGALYDGNIHLKDLTARSDQTICLAKFSTVTSAFSPDGLLVAQGDLQGTVRIWDLSAAVNGRLEPPVPDR